MAQNKPKKPGRRLAAVRVLIDRAETELDVLRKLERQLLDDLRAATTNAVDELVAEMKSKDKAELEDEVAEDA